MGGCIHALPLTCYETIIHFTFSGSGCPKRFYRNMKLNEKGRGKTTVQRWLAGSDLDKDILVLLHAVISVEEQRGWKIED